LNTQDFCGLPSFFQPHVRSGASGRWFTIGEVANADAVALPYKFRQQTSDADLDIVRMCSDGQDIQGWR
jgi:hypothetical protein